jgi:hypothetical protein
MHRPSKCGQMETYYYYTFYNSYDDEPRTYRYVPQTKQAEWIKPRRQQTQQRSPFQPTGIRQHSIDSAVKRDETVLNNTSLQKCTFEKNSTCDPNINLASAILLDKDLSTIEHYQNDKIVQQSATSCFTQYEAIMNVLTSPNVATAMLLSNIVLLVLVKFG